MEVQSAKIEGFITEVRQSFTFNGLVPGSASAAGRFSDAPQISDWTGSDVRLGDRVVWVAPSCDPPEPDYMAEVRYRLPRVTWEPSHSFLVAYIDYAPTFLRDTSRPAAVVEALRAATAQVRDSEPTNMEEFADKVRIGCTVGVSVAAKKPHYGGRGFIGAWLAYRFGREDRFFIGSLDPGRLPEGDTTGDEEAHMKTVVEYSKRSHANVMLRHAGPLWRASIDQDYCRLLDSIPGWIDPPMATTSGGRPK
jgi:hypothetical protein